MKIENTAKIVSKKIKLKIRPHSYGYNIALALLEYAQKNILFAWELKKLTSKLPDSYINSAHKQLNKKNELLTPSDKLTAMKRSYWLAERINNNSFFDTEEIISVLKNGVKNFKLSTPQQLVIGIVGLAIPGPTLGIISTKKKFTMIFNPGFAKLSKTEIAKKSVQMSLEFMKKSIIKAKKLENLDPDISDWFFGDKETNFYIATNQQIKNIKNRLEELGIPNVETNSIDQKILAVSPALNAYHMEILWKIKKLEA